MPTGDLNDGSRFGLPAIGLPQSNLSTPGSDTERRAFPGLATKSSVFAWRSDYPFLVSRTAVTGLNVDTVNLRQNTATGGVSVDVPTWAAGAVVTFTYQVVTLGLAGSTHEFWMESLVSGSAVKLWKDQQQAAMTTPKTEQVVIPFFDEPVMLVVFQTYATGTSTYSVNLLGFIRNV